MPFPRAPGRRQAGSVKVTTRTIRPAGTRGIISWCLFDWANSPTPTIVITFIFAPYFARAIAGNEAEGLALWSWGIAVSAFVIAILAPVTGAIADAGGRRKPWVTGFSLIMVVATAALWFCAPDARWIIPALVLVAVVNIAFETSIVFYNAMLPDLVDPSRFGRLSGWAWGLGYAGGIACLLLVLGLFVLADPLPFGLERGEAEHIRFVAVVTALWFIVFSWPFFLFTPDRPASGRSPAEAVRSGIRQLVDTLREFRQHRTIIRFLIARLLYVDGLNTLFALGGVYAATTFAMDEESVLLFAILLNITACAGAAFFGWIDDRIGARRTLLVSLGALIVLSVVVLITESTLWFWILGGLLGIFIGPVQSASRSLMARLAPSHMTGEMFGLFALSGKITSFAGPLLVGVIAYATSSQRLGMAVIVVLLAAGWLVLCTLEEQHDRS